MSNANTIDRIVGVATGGPQQGTKVAPAITLVTTTEKLFTDQTGATATVAFNPLSAPSSGAPQDLCAFVVRLTFKTTTGGTSTSIINLYVGSSIVAGNKLATITSASLATASASGFIEVHCIWDSTTKVLSGYQEACYGTATPLANTALSNTAISVLTVSGLTFCASATNGSSVTGTTVQIGEFCVEAS